MPKTMQHLNFDNLTDKHTTQFTMKVSAIIQNDCCLMGLVQSNPSGTESPAVYPPFLQATCHQL
jgi:hypothetical protein